METVWMVFLYNETAPALEAELPVKVHPEIFTEVKVEEMRAMAPAYPDTVPPVFPVKVHWDTTRGAVKFENERAVEYEVPELPVKVEVLTNKMCESRWKTTIHTRRSVNSRETRRGESDVP